MATTKRKRKMLNIVMVVLAAVVVVAGIVFFMSVRGGQETSSPFVVSSKIGYANIERAGINYALDKGTTLQVGDVVETLDGSEIGVKGSGETELYLADASKMQVNAADAESAKTSIELVSGCIYADARSDGETLALESAGLAWAADDAVFVSDVRTSAVSVQVLSGEVAFDDGTVVEAGESRTVITGQTQDSAGEPEAASEQETSAVAASAASSDAVAKLTLGAMNSFALEHALGTAMAGQELVFSEDQLSGEIERRKNERAQQAEQAAASDQEQTQEASGASGDANADAWDADGGDGNAEDAFDGQGYTPEVDGDDEAAIEPEPAPEPVPEESVAQDTTHTCTIQIRCDTILDNMDALAEGKSKYVPRDGTILATTYMEFVEGESAFDVLQRACGEYGIAVEYSYVPVYGSYYVEGIGNLYEFDCGDESGWMYKVNGWFPNYGCSEYKLADGDAIVFCYTCYGLGEDVGA